MNEPPTSVDEHSLSTGVLRGSRFVPSLLLGVSLVVFLATGIDWSVRVAESTSPTFSTSGADFADFDALVDKLTPPHETDHPHEGAVSWHDSHLSQFLWRELSEDTRRALSSTTTFPSRGRRIELLAADLNRILDSGYSIFNTERFPLDPEWLKGFSLRLITAADTTELPSSPEHTIIVARSPDSGALRFRLIELNAESGDPTYVDYEERDLGKRPDDLARTKAALDAPEVAQHFDAPRVPASTADPLVSDLINRLGYTGLGYEIDEANRDQARRYRAERDTDHQWLNRTLLEQSYKDEIARKLALVDDTPTETGLWDQYLREVRQFVAPASMTVANWVATDVPTLLVFQIKTVWILAVCALIPAVAGLIFRRAFWSWFVGAFSLLFLVNWTAHVMGWGGIGAELAGDLKFSFGTYLWIEVLLVLIVLAFRLERHSAALIDPRTRRNSIILAVVLSAFALAVVVGMWVRMSADLLSVSMATLFVVTARGILQPSIRSDRQSTPPTGKNIVLCLDGTWNQPGTRDFGFLAETNVYKLFTLLKGTRSGARTNARQCKEYLDAERRVRQMAFYYHGVGNSVENSQIGQVLGGAFGLGADAIVERAYLDLVRVYRPGDRVFIFGFSRGAAIARLLANVVGRRDVPKSLWTLRLFGQHWLLWRSAQTIDAAAPVKVDVLGCWDTVGAFGISKNVMGIPFQRINLLHDLDLSLCVERAYHMVALDETRDAFEPTLMDPDPTSPSRVIEVWFSGNHANVGGGYNTSQLSDITLDFLLRHVSSGYAWTEGMTPGDESWGLYLSAARKGIGVWPGVTMLDPDPCGQLRHATGAVYAHLSRTVPVRAVIHDTVFERMRGALPVYAPQSLFKLNEEIVRMRGELQTQITSLAETGSLDTGQSEEILTRSKKHLTLKKWSEYQCELQASLATAPDVRVNPAEELTNLVRV